MSIRMKVGNCNEYNKFLQGRGNVFHYINDAIENWYENSPKVAGGNNVYSDKVVILIHIITYLFRIGLKLDYMNERNSTIKLIKSYNEDGMKRWKKRDTLLEEILYRKFFLATEVNIWI